MCQEAMKAAKAAVKAANAHKTRINLQINIEGLKILDERSGAVLHNFPVSRISFIARDTADARAFGLVYGDGQGKYKFYGIKTAQSADHAVLAIRDMFQVVFEMKKKQIEQVKQQQENKEDGSPLTNSDSSMESCNGNGVAVANLLDLETELSHIEHNHIQQDPFSSFAFSQTNPFAAAAFEMSQTQGTPQIPQQQPAASFSTPFADPFAVQSSADSMADPFAVQQQSLNQFNAFASPQPQPVAPFSNPVIDWGVNENAAPVHQQATPTAWADNFANFGQDNSDSNIMKWDESAKKVTSLEEAFTKLVDMDALLAKPNDTKKNPFEHIINPPKASLNTLVGSGKTTPTPPLPLTAAHGALPSRIGCTVQPPAFPTSQPAAGITTTSDPFSDDFFR
ncbi:hypothetical protein WR25_20118 [Diploscapter pachys]|uniref:PID domain-containing protein n=1 Tax=Diploscapter pachys TaxID=2018661 RepID=A0A2A2LZG4_9BILA|nr:hypothetical protein WR25_20118 [Diploscapter pachys]